MAKDTRRPHLREGHTQREGRSTQIASARARSSAKFKALRTSERVHAQAPRRPQQLPLPRHEPLRARRYPTPLHQARTQPDEAAVFLFFSTAAYTACGELYICSSHGTAAGDNRIHRRDARATDTRHAAGLQVATENKRRRCEIWQRP